MALMNELIAPSTAPSRPVSTDPRRREVMLAGTAPVFGQLKVHPVFKRENIRLVPCDRQIAERVAELRPDVLVCDLLMPRSELSALAKALAAKSHTCQLILFCGRPLTATLEARAAGVPGKPTVVAGVNRRFPRLFDALHQALGLGVREDLRQDVEQPIELGVGGHWLPAQLVNLSLSGAKIEARSPIEVGQTVTLRHAPRKLEMRAQVVRTYRARAGTWFAGVAFEAPTLGQTDTLRTWLTEEAAKGARPVEKVELGSRSDPLRAAMRVCTTARLRLKARLELPGGKHVFLTVKNFSQVGCLAVATGTAIAQVAALKVDQRLKVLVLSRSRSFRCVTEVARLSGTDVALKFLTMGAVARRELAFFLSQLPSDGTASRSTGPASRATARAAASAGS